MIARRWWYRLKNLRKITIFIINHVACVMAHDSWVRVRNASWVMSYCRIIFFKSSILIFTWLSLMKYVILHMLVFYLNWFYCKIPRKIGIFLKLWCHFECQRVFHVWINTNIFVPISERANIAEKAQYLS